MQGTVAELIAAYPGDPTGLDTSIINPALGALVLDTTGGSPRIKSTPKGDNSGFTLIDNGIGSSLSTVPSGVTVGVPANSQAVIYGTWTITGTAIVAGEVRVGPWPF